MNIQVQLCGLIVIFLIMLFYYGNKKIGLFTEAVFTRALSGSFICLCLDILSVVMIVYSATIPDFWVKVVCKAYLVSLLWMGFAGFDYEMTELVTEARYHRLIRIFMLLGAIESLVIFLAPINYFLDGEVVYSYGLSTTLTYIFTLIYILCTVVILFVQRKVINSRRRTATTIWMILWFSSALTQFFFNELLLVGFAISMGMLTIFIMLENPEAMQDRRIGCFNSHALLMFLKQTYERKESYGVMDILIESADSENDSMIKSDVVFAAVFEYFENRKGYSVFKNVDDELLIFTKRKDNLKIEKEFEDFYNKKIASKYNTDVKIIVLDDTNKVKNYDDLFAILKMSAINVSAQSEYARFTLGEEAVNKYYRYHEVVKEIELALSEDRVEVFYQPIYSNAKERYVSCEALARIRRKDGTLLSPGEFIPVAEDSGLIVQLGERVFTKVCQFLNINQNIKNMLDYVEVNLSVAQFEEDNLADKFIRIMQKYDIEPHKINLEITETASIQTKKMLLENMNRFIDYGVKFSLDDFGKGESNLMYVVEMPVSIVKLDMDMTKAYFVEPKAKCVVAATVRMAHELGLHVVAEGVEDKDELSAMREEKIDFIQGYYFSKPVKESDFIKMLTL